MTISNQRLEALRKLHTARREKTQFLLHAGLDAMESGKTSRITVPFKWTKTNWAKEAGVHVSSIEKKKDGEKAFGSLIARFEALRQLSRQRSRSENNFSDTQVQKWKQLEVETENQRMKLAEQAELVAQLRSRLAEIPELNAEIGILMEENAEQRLKIAELERKCHSWEMLSRKTGMR